jgi:hypothetical protein
LALVFHERMICCSWESGESSMRASLRPPVKNIAGILPQ